MMTLATWGLALVLAAPLQGGASKVQGASAHGLVSVLSGRVVDGNDQPLPGIPVAAVSETRIDALAADWMRIPIERIVLTDAGGRFRFSVPRRRAGDSFVVFTGSLDHFNQVYSKDHGVVDGLVPLPTRGDLRAIGVRGVVPGQGSGSIEFRLARSNLLADVPVPVGKQGVRLLADVYLASDGSRRTEGSAGNPVILVRTPYSRKGPDPANPNSSLLGRFKSWTLFGYTVVVQNTRGSGGSGGSNLVFLTDSWGGVNLRDGFDSVEWAAAQGFSDGRVGLWGSSAMGIAGYLAAGSCPPSLRALYSWSGTPDLYRFFFDDGGPYREEAMEPWLASQLGGPAGRDAFLNMPSGVAQNYFRSPFWDRVNVELRLPQVKVPILHVAGWFDLFKQPAVDSFQLLQAGGSTGGGGAAGSFDNQWMLIGPYAHTNWFNAAQGDVLFPPSAGPSTAGGPANAAFRQTLFFRSEIDFFDEWLRLEPRGLSNGFSDLPPVRYYTMGDTDAPSVGGNVWREAQSWPPPDLVRSTRKFYLVGQGGRLVENPFAGAPPLRASHPDRLTYRYDPLDPAPSIGGPILYASGTAPAGPRDQRPAEARADVLTFSMPLSAPLEVTGEIRAHLAVSSDALDTDFVVKLTDVYPDGRSILIAEGVLQARYRNGHHTGSDLMSGDPDDVQRVVVSLGDTSMVFAAGHELRISVTSSSYPRLKPNPNTGARFFTGDVTAANSRPAQNTIWTRFWQSSRASWVTLPVVESGP